MPAPFKFSPLKEKPIPHQSSSNMSTPTSTSPVPVQSLKKLGAPPSSKPPNKRIAQQASVPVSTSLSLSSLSLSSSSSPTSTSTTPPTPLSNQELNETTPRSQHLVNATIPRTRPLTARRRPPAPKDSSETKVTSINDLLYLKLPPPSSSISTSISTSTNDVRPKTSSSLPPPPPPPPPLHSSNIYLKQAASTLLTHITSSDPLLSILSSSTDELYDDIMLAVGRNDVATVKKLLVDANGIDLQHTHAHSKANQIKAHPLSKSVFNAIQTNNATILQMLLTYCPSLIYSIHPNSGESLLHLSVYAKSLPLTKMLLDFVVSGFPLNNNNNNKSLSLSLLDSKNEYNETPLHYACRSSSYEIMLILLCRGCDTSVVNRWDETAREECVDLRCEKLVKRYDAIRMGRKGNERERECVSYYPSNVLLKVISYLPLHTLAQFSSVCQRFNLLIDDNSTMLYKNLGIERVWEHKLKSTMGNNSRPNSGGSDSNNSSNNNSRPGSSSNSSGMIGGRSSRPGSSSSSSLLIRDRDGHSQNNEDDGGDGSNAVLDAFSQPAMGMFRPKMNSSSNSRRK